MHFLSLPMAVRSGGSFHQRRALTRAGRCLIATLLLAGVAVGCNDDPGDGGGATTGGGETTSTSGVPDVGVPDTEMPPEDTETPPEDSEPAPDTTVPDDTDLPLDDTATPDTATPDTGTPDTDTPDTGTPDTGPADTGMDVDPDLPPEPLRIVSVVPDRGPIQGQTPIAIEVVGTLNDEPLVLIGGRPATRVEVVTPNLLTAETPQGSAGSTAVKIVMPNAEDSLEEGYTYFAPLALTSVTPN
ncbi:MAG: IPT/TIG domain-containing protein, partial [Myxococcota bacterium]